MVYQHTTLVTYIYVGNYASQIDVSVDWTKHCLICRFIVHGGSPGLKISKIENKVSLRVVQNCNIQLDNVFVPDDDRLPGANSFQDLVDVRNKIALVDGVDRCPAYGPVWPGSCG